MHARAQNQRTGGSMIDRMIGVLRLERPVYERIAHDRNMMIEAVIIVASVAILTLINGILETNVSAPEIVGSVILVPFVWLFTGLVSLLVGRMTADYSDLEGISLDSTLHLVGYAMAPLLLLVFAPIPGLGAIIFLAAAIWTLVTMVMAIQVAARVSAIPAVFILIGGIVATLIVTWMLVAIVALVLFAFQGF